MTDLKSDPILEVLAKPDAKRIEPKLDEYQVPFCNERCPYHDGKRCELLGHRPDSVCIPAVRILINTDGNNSWGYRWITDSMRRKRATQHAVSAEAKELARRLSLALGGDGESGVQPFLTPNDTVGLRVNLYGKTAERLLEAIALAEVGPDFFTGKHWEILTSSGNVIGCTADRDDARRQESSATFREVKIEMCSSCREDATFARFLGGGARRAPTADES